MVIFLACNTLLLLAFVPFDILNTRNFPMRRNSRSPPRILVLAHIVYSMWSTSVAILRSVGTAIGRNFVDVKWFLSDVAGISGTWRVINTSYCFLAVLWLQILIQKSHNVNEVSTNRSSYWTQNRHKVRSSYYEQQWMKLLCAIDDNTIMYGNMEKSSAIVWDKVSNLNFNANL